jgi:thioredoxin 1
MRKNSLFLNTKTALCTRLTDTGSGGTVEYDDIRPYYEDGMADNYIQVTRENFSEQVLQAPHLVIVNFSREQSIACQIQDPEFEALSKEFLDRIIFARLNIEGQNDFTNQWHVDSVPTLIFFKDGQEVYRIIGVVMRHKLRRKIEGVLLVN